eukprot:s1526_g7.t1
MKKPDLTRSFCNFQPDSSEVNRCPEPSLGKSRKRWSLNGYFYIARSDGGDTNGSKDKLPSVPGLRKQLRKTKYCVFHLQGVCHFGDSCAFAHTLEELQGVPDLKKTKLCRFKVCKDGNCPFAHSEKELRSTDTCYKKTLCMWHAKGRCRNGEQCRFAHGTAELRPPKILRHRGGAGPDLQNPSSSSQHSSSSSSSLPQAMEFRNTRDMGRVGNLIFGDILHYFYLKLYES